jgi:hypothetical protein
MMATAAAVHSRHHCFIPNTSVDSNCHHHFQTNIVHHHTHCTKWQCIASVHSKGVGGIHEHFSLAILTAEYKNITNNTSPLMLPSTPTNKMPTLASPFYCSPMTAPPSNQATQPTETFHFFNRPPDQLTSSPHWPPDPSSPVVNSVITDVLPLTMPTLSPLSSLPVHISHLLTLKSQVPPSHSLSKCRSSTPNNLLHQHHLHYHHHC